MACRAVSLIHAAVTVISAAAIAVCRAIGSIRRSWAVRPSRSVRSIRGIDLASAAVCSTIGGAIRSIGAVGLRGTVRSPGAGSAVDSVGAVCAALRMPVTLAAAAILLSVGSARLTGIGVAGAGVPIRRSAAISILPVCSRMAVLTRLAVWI